MTSTLEELAEHTEVHLLPRPTFDTVNRGGVVYLGGLNGANVHPYRVADVPAAVDWCRAESRRRGHSDVEWWVGGRRAPRASPSRRPPDRARPGAGRRPPLADRHDVQRRPTRRTRDRRAANR